MRTRTFIVPTLVIIFILSWTSIAAVQELPANPAAPSAPADAGQPGLSFRYVETFGVTEQAYLPDMQHLNGPNGLFIDHSGQLYLAEELGARILAYDTPEADSATRLSIGTAGLQNRGATTFDHPLDVAVDDQGHIWEVDRHRVAQYDAAGNFLQEFPPDDPWNRGSDNSHFDGPRGIAFDAQGRLYVADDYNHRVQVYSVTVDSTLVYSTTLGETGVSGSDDSHFNRPAQVAFDSSGRLYVTDVNNYRVQRCTYAGGWTCTTFHGTGSSGDGASELNLAFGLTVDAGDDVYIADAVNGRVKKCDTAGACTVFASGIEWPADVAVDAAGRVYVSDFYEHIIRLYTSSGDQLARFEGDFEKPYVTDNRHFNQPYGVAVDAAGNVLLTEFSGYRLVKLDAGGTPRWSVGEPGIFGDDDLHFGGLWDGPAAVAVDCAGNAYVADTDNHRVQKCTPAGACTTFAGVPGEAGSDDAHFEDPFGVAVDAAGNVYVAEQDNHRVQKCTPDGACTTFAGVTGEIGSDDAHFDEPVGVAVDADGNVYVADAGNRRVQKCTPGGSCTTFAGTTGVWGDSFDHLGRPRDVAVDARGRVYVADPYNQRVQVFDGSGAYLTTIGGAWGSANGQLRHANGVAVDARGNVYVADGLNHRIQKFAPGVPGWQQVNVNGFGSRDNTCASSLAVFQDRLYAGTSNDGDRGGEIWRYDGPGWTAVNLPGFGTAQNQHVRGLVALDGYLYAGTTNQATGGEIWRTGDGENWTPMASGGFGDANNVEINHLSVFSATLYASTANHATGAEIWRNVTGTAGGWTQVNSDGFGDANNASAWFMAGFKGHLYAGTSNRELWRFAEGTGWTNVTQGFGNTANTWVHALAVFEDQLYASTGNWAAGGEIWRSSTGDARDWTQVVSGGFDDLNNAVIRLAGVHEGQLYASTANWVTGQEIWRTGDGTNWEQVNIGGFGDSNNFDPFWNNASTVYDGSLYVGTCNEANGGEVWQMLHQIYLPVVIREA